MRGVTGCTIGGSWRFLTRKVTRSCARSGNSPELPPLALAGQLALGTGARRAPAATARPATGTAFWLPPRDGRRSGIPVRRHPGPTWTPTPGIVQSSPPSTDRLSRVRPAPRQGGRERADGNRPPADRRCGAIRAGNVEIRAYQAAASAGHRGPIGGGGWPVEADGKIYRTAGNFEMQVQSGIDWFDLNAKMSFDGVAASLPSYWRPCAADISSSNWGMARSACSPKRGSSGIPSLAELG